MMGRLSVPVTETIVLAVWIGAALLFALVVAPAAFAVLPTRALAGALVGRVLPVIFYAGALVGVLVVLLDLSTGASAWGRTAAAAVSTVACISAQLVIGSRIDRLRQSIGGPLDALAPDDPRRLAFGRLHAVSVGWLALAMVAAAVAMTFAVRSVTNRH